MLAASDTCCTEPTVASVSHTAVGVQIDLIVPASLYYLQGHFPGCPLVPGVTQLTWAIEFARREFSIDGPFASVSGLKFMRVIQPDCPVSLHLAFDARQRRLTFEYRNANGACSGGTVQFGEQVGD